MAPWTATMNPTGFPWQTFAPVSGPPHGRGHNRRADSLVWFWRSIRQVGCPHPKRRRTEMILEVQSRRMPADKPFCRSMPSIPFALDAPADGRPRDNERSRMELLNHFPTRVFHAAMVGEFGGGLGYARCRSLRPPPDRACRCLSVEPRAEPSDHSAPFRTVACCFSDGVVISPADPDCGERQHIPSPGAGGRQRNCKCQKKSRAECIHPGEPNSPETEGGR